MSAEPYSQTILLDANRLSSEEYSASNLAQTDTSVFTNRVAGGITLDIGDQVSIQSAHIAQRGAGGEVIEMKGRSLGKKTINYTKLTNASFIGYNLTSAAPSRYTPTGYVKQDAENIDEEVDMKDNESTIVVEFYKTANGENCMTLPRNFGNVSANNASVAHYNQAGGAGLALASDYWETEDGIPLGVNTFAYDPQRRFTLDDNDIRDDWRQQYLMRSASGAQVNAGKVRQDNSRFTLFKRKSMVYNGSLVSAADLALSLQPHGAATAPDPAIADYIRFKKKVNIKIDEGYNTPSNIASQITDQLTEPEDSRNVIESQGQFKTIIQESKINVAFGSPSYVSYNSSACQAFFNGNLVNSIPVGVTPGTSLQTAQAVAYNNAYDFVGFKRPELVETGRAAFPFNGQKLVVNIFKSDRAKAIIDTNMPWNDENLLKIKRFFDSQTLYPELLDGGVDTKFPRTDYSTFNTTSASISASFREVGRFLHIDIGHQSQGSLKSDTEPLGDDMYNTSFNTSGANGSDKTSAPIFVFFNNNSSHLTATETIGDRNDNLAYGFGRKTTANDFISFTTELIGGIPESLFDMGPAPAGIVLDTKIGYDYHFNAYGNAALLLHSGYNPVQYFGHQAFLQAEYIENVYVGADNPLFNFDSVENRFEFKNLHTAEKSGNFYNAGDPQVPGDILGPPPSSTAQDPVYFINKQMRYDNWSPDIHPYPTINLSGTVAGNDVQSFINSPLRLQAGLPYDAHSGVSIVDMGIDETNWTDSIWGLLGFRYGQFNGSGANIKNENFTFSNLPSNTQSITTNALLTSLQSQQYVQNVFSVPLIKPMVGSNVEYYNTSITQSSFASKTADHIVSPAISVQQESTVVKASDLPRKVLRGYFLVNSDILDQANYYQQANPLSTMAVVGKYNSAEDFVNYDGGGAVFTVTRKKTITDIKTQILDPEGSLAQVGDNSGVIYKIDKQIKTDLRFGENLLSGMYGKVQA